MEIPRSIDEAAALLRRRAQTCAGLVEACLERIAALQPKLNAFITIGAESALRQAEALDRELSAARDRGPLHGIPMVFKDCLDTAGMRTTMGSRFFAERVPSVHAAAVERLENAGAVILGKTNMNELAAGTSGTNAAYGDVRNPWALDRSPGGSSAGSAAAVASRMALAGLGTDTGGSIRIPAACTGLVGIRPTFGRISLRGCFPRSFTFDTVAPLARSVRDCALVLQGMAGHDGQDPSSLDAPVEDYAQALDPDLTGMRIGVIRNFSFADLDPQIEQALGTAVEALAALGAEVREVAIPELRSDSRYEALVDVLLYEFHQILREHWRQCPNPHEVFGPVVRANIERGMAIPESAYRSALASRGAHTAALRSAFTEVDALVTPVIPEPTPRLDAPAEAFDRQRRFMIPFSFAGLPAISVPCAASAEGLPIGLQLVADRLAEKRLFRIAQAYEAVSGWHDREPQRP